MSGGFFEYKQYALEDIKEKLEEVLNQVNTKPNLVDMLSGDFNLYNYVEDKEAFNLVCKTAMFYLDMAQIITQRLDWFLSGDDSEQSFHKRISEDVQEALETHNTFIQEIQDENK